MLASEQFRLLSGACFAACVLAADAGDDFSNNLFTDLAPLLALFGERVSTQFMSQSMGWADNIIFAMAPLGIITAIVGAIRVGGPSWLKALIGRARESRAVAESELMSSTSHEVCELWNGQEIVRVMGTGPIREFIILLPEGNSDGTSKENVPTTARTQDATSEAGSDPVSSLIAALNSNDTGEENTSARARAQYATSERGSGLATSLMVALNTNQKTLVMDLESSKKPGYLKDCDLTFQERISSRFTHQDSPRTKGLPEGTAAEDIDPPGLASQSNPTLRSRFLGKRGPRQDRDSEKALPALDAPRCMHRFSRSYR